LPNKRLIQKAEKFRDNQFYESQQVLSCGYGFDDIKKSNKHFKSFEVGFGRNNPNDNTFQKKKNKK